MGDNHTSFANSPTSVARLTLEGLLLVIVKKVATAVQTAFLSSSQTPRILAVGPLQVLVAKLRSRSSNPMPEAVSQFSKAFDGF